MDVLAMESVDQEARLAFLRNLMREADCCALPMLGQ
jgi:hypothetical protein